MAPESICAEAEQLLSEFEKMIYSVKRIEVRGKKGRQVPALLRKYHVSAIETIITIKERAGVVLVHIC